MVTDDASFDRGVGSWWVVAVGEHLMELGGKVVDMVARSEEGKVVDN